jgi:hydrogenase maturation factor HypF (carbamoyltransferase family)
MMPAGEIYQRKLLASVVRSQTNADATLRQSRGFVERRTQYPQDRRGASVAISVQPC